MNTLNFKTISEEEFSQMENKVVLTNLNILNNDIFKDKPFQIYDLNKHIEYRYHEHILISNDIIIVINGLSIELVNEINSVYMSITRNNDNKINNIYLYINESWNNNEQSK